MEAPDERRFNGEKTRHSNQAARSDNTFFHTLWTIGVFPRSTTTRRFRTKRPFFSSPCASAGRATTTSALTLKV